MTILRTPRFVAEVLLELRDLWIGIFWDRRLDGFHLFACLVPCLPIHLHWPSNALPLMPSEALRQCEVGLTNLAKRLKDSNDARRH